MSRLLSKSVRSPFEQVYKKVYRQAFEQVWEKGCEQAFEQDGEKVCEQAFWASWRESLWAAFWASVQRNLWASLWVSWWASLWASVKERLWASLCASLWGSLWETIRTKKSTRKPVSKSLSTSTRNLWQAFEKVNEKTKSSKFLRKSTSNGEHYYCIIVCCSDVRSVGRSVCLRKQHILENPRWSLLCSDVLLRRAPYMDCRSSQRMSIIY